MSQIKEESMNNNILKGMKLVILYNLLLVFSIIFLCYLFDSLYGILLGIFVPWSKYQHGEKVDED